MNTTELGRGGPLVSAIGLGTLAMSGMYGRADRAESIGTIRAELDAGVTLLDTGDFYGMGYSELLLAEALGNRRDDVVLSVKFGAQRDPSGTWLGHDVRPKAAKTALAYTLTRLGTDYIDIYRPARIDPAVPIEETIGALGELVDAGFVRHIALSEVGAETLRRAHAVRPIVDVQLEYSLMSRAIEAAVLPACRAFGVSVTAYGVLSRGLLSGHWTADREFAKHDFRAYAPRFQRGNLEQNLTLVEQLRETARTLGATVAQVAIAWVASRGNNIIPLIGSRRRDQLEEALGALSLHLSAEDVAAIEQALPADAASGERYSRTQMATLDSERS